MDYHAALSSRSLSFFTVAICPSRGNVSYDVDLLFVQFRLVQASVDPVEMFGRVGKVQQDPKVQVVAHIRVQRDQS